MNEELGVRRAAPAHCTGMPAFQVFREVYGTDYVAAGLGSEVHFVQWARRRQRLACFRTKPSVQR